MGSRASGTDWSKGKEGAEICRQIVIFSKLGQAHVLCLFFRVLALCKEHGSSEVTSSWTYLSPTWGWRGRAGA